MGDPSMKAIFLLIGRFAGGAGVLLALFAGAARLSGRFWVGSYQAGTLLLGGIALMVIACLGLLLALTWEQSSDNAK